jgi:hypothetical protein
LLAELERATGVVGSLAEIQAAPTVLYLPQGTGFGGDLNVDAVAHLARRFL